MRIYTLLIMILLGMFMSINEASAQKRGKWMTDARMETILKKYIERVDGEKGNWQLVHNGRLVFVLTDKESNRMRIFTPVIEEKDLRNGELDLMLKANFHTALDAKYCMYEGFVISIYTHPLKELTEDQLLSAVGQVVNLADTFGVTYSSTSMLFEGDAAEIPEEKIEKKQLKRS